MKKHTYNSCARLGLLAVLGFCVMASTSLTGCDKQRAESIKLINEGIRKLDAGRTEAAYSYFKRASKLDPDNGQAFYEMALVDLYDRDRRQEGLANMEQAEKLLGEDRDVLYHLGRTYADNGDLERADRYLGRAIAVDPNLASAHYYRGRALLRLNKPDEADAALREAIAIKPDDPAPYVDLGDLYERFNADDAAAAVYEEGIRQNPAAPDSLNALGILRLQQGNAPAAIKLFDKAMAVGGGRADSVFNLAFAYVEANDTKKAFRYLTEFIETANEGEQGENIRVAMALREGMRAQLKEEMRAKLNKPQAPQ